MTIKNNFSTVHTTKKPNRKIEYIVIHYTAGTTSRTGSAVNTANFFTTTTTQVSADFTVDDTTVVQYNGDIKNRYTWHCGGNRYVTKGGKFYGKCTNANSIGIEICSKNSTGKMQNANDKSYSFTDAAVANAVLLVKKLMLEYNIPAENVIRHYDVTGKLCPGIIGWNAESGFETAWDDFKKSIGEKNTDAAPKYYCIQVGMYCNKSYAEKELKRAKKYFPDAFIKVM